MGRLWCRCLVRLELRLGCRPVSNVKLATLSHEHRRAGGPAPPTQLGSFPGRPGEVAAAPRSVGSAGVPTVPCAVSPGSSWSARARAAQDSDDRPLRRSCSATGSCRGPPRVAGTVREKFRPGLGVGVPGQCLRTTTIQAAGFERPVRGTFSDLPLTAGSSAVTVTVTAVLARARGGLGPRDASEFELLQT